MSEDNKVYKLELAIADSAIKVQGIKTQQGRAPSGVSEPSKAVEPAVIGYWIELLDQHNCTLYRRFIHNQLPLNIPHMCKNWSKRRQHRTRFEITLPACKGITHARLYEQCLRNQQDKQPRCVCHLDLALQDGHIQSNALANIA